MYKEQNESEQPKDEQLQNVETEHASFVADDETVAQIPETSQENLSEDDAFAIPEADDDILEGNLNFDESTVAPEEDDFQIPDVNENVSNDDSCDAFDSEEEQAEQNKES